MAPEIQLLKEQKKNEKTAKHPRSGIEDEQFKEQLKADYDLESELSGESTIMFETLPKIQALLATKTNKKDRLEIFECHKGSLRAYLQSSKFDLRGYIDEMTTAKEYFMETVQDSESEPDDLQYAEELLFEATKAILIQARFRKKISEHYQELCKLCDISVDVNCTEISELEKTSLKIYTSTLTTLHAQKILFMKKHQRNVVPHV